MILYTLQQLCCFKVDNVLTPNSFSNVHTSSTNGGRIRYMTENLKVEKIESTRVVDCTCSNSCSRIFNCNIRPSWLRRHTWHLNGLRTSCCMTRLNLLVNCGFGLQRMMFARIGNHFCHGGLVFVEGHWAGALRLDLVHGTSNGFTCVLVVDLDLNNVTNFKMI